MSGERWCPVHGLHGEWDEDWPDGDCICLRCRRHSGLLVRPITPDVVAAIEARGARHVLREILRLISQHIDEIGFGNGTRAQKVSQTGALMWLKHEIKTRLLG